MQGPDVVEASQQHEVPLAPPVGVIVTLAKQHAYIPTADATAGGTIKFSCPGCRMGYRKWSQCQQHVIACIDCFKFYFQQFDNDKLRDICCV